MHALAWMYPKLGHGHRPPRRRNECVSDQARHAADSVAQTPTTTTAPNTLPPPLRRQPDGEGGPKPQRFPRRAATRWQHLDGRQRTPRQLGSPQSDPRAVEVRLPEQEEGRQQVSSRDRARGLWCPAEPAPRARSSRSRRRATGKAPASSHASTASFGKRRSVPADKGLRSYA